MNLTLVVGSGRCGSALLSRILRGHPELLSIGDLFTLLTAGRWDLPLGETDGEAVWALLTGARPLPAAPVPAGSLRALLPSLTDDPGALRDALEPVVRGRPSGPAAAHYRAFLEHLATLSGRSAIAGRAAASPHRMPALHAAFPDARVVHMYRDGPDCALSMSRHAGYRTLASPRRAGTAARSTYPIPLPVFGALWSSMILDGVAALEMLPPHLTTTLRYEDLLRSPEAELTRLAAVLGVTVDGDWLARSRALLGPAATGLSRSLPAGDRAALDAACAPGMTALGLTP